MLKLVGAATSKGLDGERVAANFMIEEFGRKARRALERVKEAQRRLVEARSRVMQRRRAYAARAAEGPRERARLQRDVDDAWRSNVVAGTELAKAMREADVASHQFELVLAEWAPSAGPEARRHVEATAQAKSDFQAACLDEVRASEARFRAELARWEAATALPTRFADPEKPAVCGPFRVMQRTDGVYIVVDERRPMGDRTVAEVGRKLVEANEQARRLFDFENARTGVGT